MWKRLRKVGRLRQWLVLCIGRRNIWCRNFILSWIRLLLGSLVLECQVNLRVYSHVLQNLELACSQLILSTGDKSVLSWSYLIGNPCRVCISITEKLRKHLIFICLICMDRISHPADREIRRIIRRHVEPSPKKAPGDNSARFHLPCYQLNRWQKRWSMGIPPLEQVSGSSKSGSARITRLIKMMSRFYTRAQFHGARISSVGYGWV